MQEEFGAYLRAQRELRGVSLEEIFSETKIPLRHLEALEGNEQDDLPDEVFVKGYIKSYADAIGANADEVLIAYDETVIAPIREEAEHQRVIEESFNRRKKNIFIGVLSAVIISGLVAAGYWFISEEPLNSKPRIASSTKKIEEAEGKKNIESAKVEPQLDEENLEEEPETNDDSKTTSIDKPKDETKTVEVASKPVESKKPLIETKKDNNTAESGIKRSEQKKPESASITSKNSVKEIRAGNPENSVTIQAHKNNAGSKNLKSLHLVVQAKEEGWFNLIIDGSIRKDFILPAGTSISFKAEKSVNVWIGNRKGTELILNKKTLKLPESLDNVIRNFAVTAQLLE